MLAEADGPAKARLDDHRLGEQPVFERVEFGDGLAVPGNGASGLLGIAPVGVELF